MMASESVSNRSPTLSLYQLHLPTYEGPLDVLLRLIERSQLAIEDLSLVTVTDQFIAFVATLDEAPPAVVAEFTAVGARLTVIKSRSLLPKPPVIDEEPFVSDLTEQLREYKQLKDMAKQMGDRLAQGLSAFSTGQRATATLPKASGETRLTSYPIEALTRALRRCLTTVSKPSKLITQRRVVSLRELVERLAHLVTRDTRMTFTHFIGATSSRTHAATAFLAVLVLIRRQSIQAQQEDLFSEIHLVRNVVDEVVSMPDVGEETFPSHLENTNEGVS